MHRDNLTKHHSVVSRGVKRPLPAFQIAKRTSNYGDALWCAHEIGLLKLTAHMTSDQRGAQAAFRRLGFVPEAHLADYVQDRNGTTRDMVIMSFDVDGHTDQAMGTVKL